MEDSRIIFLQFPWETPCWRGVKQKGAVVSGTPGFTYLKNMVFFLVCFFIPHFFPMPIPIKLKH